MGASSSAEQELHARIRQQEVVAKLGQQALEDDDLDQLMHDATVYVAETLNNDYCKVLELLAGGNELFLRAGVGWDEGFVGDATVGTERESQAGFTLLSEEPIVVDDLRSESRFSGPDLLVDHDVISGISVIIGSTANPWGILGTHTTEQREFTEHDANFVRSVANVLGSSIRRAERERELERYETLVETINDGIYAVDEDGRFTMVNDAYAELTGYPREELLGNHGTLVVDEETSQRAEETEAAILDGRTKNPTVQAEVQAADGSHVPVEATVATLSTDGSTRERVGVVRDVTRRKEQQRKLKESERRYRTLVEHFPNGAVGLYDEELQYTAAGGELLQKLGISTREVRGTSIYERYPDDIVREIEPYFTAALDGEANTFEVEYHDRHLWAHTLPIREADGEIYAGMLMVQDVTERVESRQQLEESNRRLEQFAYAASHDLQEPLRMVSSYLQLVERRYADELDEDGREFIDFAVDGANRMREMIDGLLEYSRIDTKGGDFELVDCDDLLDEVLDNLQMTIEETGAKISADRLPTVYGDESQLTQLFQNLLSNAIKYRSDAPPRIHVTAERDGNEWTFSVSDNGIGIEPADRERIFEVFQRLHTATEYSGTGIGLALCQRIVERHGGRIWVESEPDEGSTFSFTLPASEGTDD